MIEDNVPFAELINEFLLQSDKAIFNFIPVERLELGLLRLEEGGIDIVLLDLGLPDSSGLNTLRSVLKQDPDVPVVIITGYESEGVADEAIREGAQDYLLKGHLDNRVLDRTLIYAIERNRLRTELLSKQTLLQQTEDKYRFIVEKQTDGVTLGDLHENILFANPAMDRIFGLTTGTMAGRNLSGFMTEESLEFIKEQTKKRQQGVSNSYNLDIIRPNGQERHLYIHTQPWYNESGEVIGSMGVVHDETDRRIAERKIQRQKENLQETVDHRTRQLLQAKNMWERTFDVVPDIVIIVDTDYNITRTNRALSDESGMPIKELIGRKCYEVIYGTDEPIGKCLVRQMLKDHEEHSGEQYLERYDKTFYISVSPLRNEHGVIEGGVMVARDISALKEAEKKITTERDRAQHYLDIAAVIIVGLDSQGNITLINRKGCEILEYEHDELIGKNWFENCIPERLAKEVGSVFYRLLNSDSEAVLYNENLIKTKSGGERIIAWNNTIYVNEDDKAVGVLSSGEDITDRKVAEQELELSRENYKAIFDNTNEAVFIHDMETGEILDVNPAMTRMYDYDYDEALRLSIGEVSSGVPPYTQEDALKWIYKALNGESQLFEWHAKSKNGKLFWVEVNLTRTTFDGGDCVLAVVRDINQQKIDRMEIQKFKTISDRANYGAVITDTEGKIVYVNRYYADIHGYSIDELIGNNMSIFHNPNQFEVVEQLNEDLLKSGSYAAEEVWHQYKDGFVFPMLMNAVLIKSPEGVPLYQAVTAIDITMRKQLEFKLEKERNSLDKNVKKRTEELSIALTALKHASKVKSDFLATMNHELRTPLNTILGMTEVLQDNIYGELNPEQEECLTEIAKSSTHLQELVQDILYLSKIESDEVDVHAEQFPIVAVCNSCLASIEEAAGRKNITVVPDLPVEDLIIEADSEQIKQLLTHLLGNAVKFTPQDGSIGLDVTADEEAGKIEFSVWDSGTGIDTDMQRKIFDPFTKQDTSYTRHYYGTGLGLALVYRIVELQGGSINLESELNKGSRFTVSLPYSEDFVPRIDTYDEGVKRILIVEDDGRTIDRITKFFTPYGHKLTAARNSDEALSYVNERKRDLILLDAQIPVTSGLEVVTQIRSDPEHANVPLIAIATLVLKGDKGKFLRAGADEFLHKPISGKMLTTIVDKYL